MSTSFVIAGAGAVGLATAEALLRQGAAVTVLERNEVGRESSWAGGGILSPLCPWDYPDAVTRLALRGMALFPAWAERLLHETGIDPEFEASGMRVFAPLDMSSALAWCGSHGMRCATGADGSLLLPEVAQVRNPRLLQAQRAMVERLGGRIVEQCAVQKLNVEGGRVRSVSAGQGDFTADGFVIAGGAWSSQLLGELAAGAAIKPIRGQMLLFKFPAPPLPHIYLQQDLYLIPRRDGHVLVGSTLEDVGFDKSTTDEARDRLVQRAAVLLPQLADMQPVRHWAGLRPGSPGNIPTIGRHPRLQNLYINSGHFRYGVTMAPAGVEILLNEIEGREQALDVSPYRWGQVADETAKRI